MIEDIRYQWRAWKITRQRDAIAASYRQAKAKLGKGIDYTDIWAEHRADDELLEDEFVGLDTGYLVAKARRLQIPAPAPDDVGAWTEAKLSWSRHLTEQARLELRREIRKEQKERGENFRNWLASLTGLGGVIVALVALLTRK